MNREVDVALFEQWAKWTLLIERLSVEVSDMGARSREVLAAVLTEKCLPLLFALANLAKIDLADAIKEFLYVYEEALSEDAAQRGLRKISAALEDLTEREAGDCMAGRQACYAVCALEMYFQVSLNPTVANVKELMICLLELPSIYLGEFACSKSEVDEVLGSEQALWEQLFQGVLAYGSQFVTQSVRIGHVGSFARMSVLQYQANDAAYFLDHADES